MGAKSDRALPSPEAPMVAILAAVALKRIELAQVPKLVLVERTFSPNDQHRATYDRNYERFLGFWGNNRKWFASK